MYPKPIPTNLPQARGIQTYIPMSSAVDPRAANYVIPVSSASNQLNAYGAPLTQTNPFKTNQQVVPTNPLTGQFLEPTPQPGPAPAPQQSENNGFDQAIARARAAYESALRDADYQFGRARGIFDEGNQILGKRREQFTNLYNQGKDSILDRYEGERGNLQAAAQGAQQRAANVLRAMGITGGSGAINYEGRQRQENMKQLGALQTQRNQNEQANQGQFDERELWADAQERALQRSLDDAANARRSFGEKSGLVYQGDVDAVNREAGAFQNILNNVMGGLRGIQGGIDSFAANPFSTNIADMAGAISPIVPTVASAGGAGVQNVNLNEQDPRLAMLDPRKRQGVAGAGLYA